MAALSAASKVVARRLLAWDRARVASIERKRPGVDGSVYKGRQALAGVAIDADVDAWPHEVRTLFRQLLEVTRVPGTPAKVVGIGALRADVAKLTRPDREAYKQLAREIGVIRKLREVSPLLWSDDDHEGGS